MITENDILSVAFSMMSLAACGKIDDEKKEKFSWRMRRDGVPAARRRSILASYKWKTYYALRHAKRNAGLGLRQTQHLSVEPSYQYQVCQTIVDTRYKRFGRPRRDSVLALRKVWKAHNYSPEEQARWLAVCVYDPRAADVCAAEGLSPYEIAKGKLPEGKVSPADRMRWIASNLGPHWGGLQFRVPADISIYPQIAGAVPRPFGHYLPHSSDAYIFRGKPAEEIDGRKMRTYYVALPLENIEEFRSSRSLRDLPPPREWDLEGRLTLWEHLEEAAE